MSFSTVFPDGFAGLPPEGLAICAWALVELRCHDTTVLNAIAEAAKEQVPWGKSVSKLQVTMIKKFKRTLGLILVTSSKLVLCPAK